MSLETAAQSVHGEMQALLRRLREQPLNVARSVELPRINYGYRDGQPLTLSKGTLLPSTGIASLDETSRQISSLSDFTKDSFRKITTSTVKGGIYGSICGLLLVFFKERADLLKIFQKKLPNRLLYWGSVISIACGAIGSIAGGLFAVQRQARQGLEMLKQLK